MTSETTLAVIAAPTTSLPVIGAEMLGRIEQRLWPRWRMFIEHVETIWRRPDDVSGRRAARSATSRTPR
jgi:hypothetical protein